jgi:hypothetical protein
MQDQDNEPKKPHGDTRKNNSMPENPVKKKSQIHGEQKGYSWQTAGFGRKLEMRCKCAVMS